MFEGKGVLGDSCRGNYKFKYFCVVCGRPLRKGRRNKSKRCRDCNWRVVQGFGWGGVRG